MKTQISRFPDDPARHYSGVYQQQGRMLTDADWNAFVETLKGRLAHAVATVIGSGAPSQGGIVDFGEPSQANGVRFATGRSLLRDGGVALVDGLEGHLELGYSVSLTPQASALSTPIFARNSDRARVPETAQLIRSHLYDFEAERLSSEIVAVDGPAAVSVARVAAPKNTRDAYLSQASFPNAPAPPRNLKFQLYLDVWERTITALEDPTLTDPALHGADTTTRTQVVAQVKWAPLQPDLVEDERVNPRRGALRLTAEELSPAAVSVDDPCTPEVTLDASLQNFLLRIEVHEHTLPEWTERIRRLPDDEPADADEALLVVKWSTENGAEAYAVDEAPQEFRERPGAVFEFFDDATEKNLGVHLAPGFAPPRGRLTRGWPSDNGGHFPFVRRWDGYATLTASGANELVWALADSSPEVEIDKAPASLKVTIQGIVARLELPVVHRSRGWAKANRRSTMAGDYWLVRVRSEAPSGQRVQVESALPSGVLHHYLPLFRVEAGEDPEIEPLRPSNERAAHFRRLRYPYFSQLNLEAVDAITTLIDGLRTDVNACVKKTGDTMTGPLQIRGGANGAGANLSVGPIATPTVPGRVEISGSSGELTLWDRGLGAAPSSWQPGDRFVWYNDSRQARLFTDGRGDLLTIGDEGQLHIKGPSAELTLWDRQAGNTPPSPAGPGNRFVWYNDSRQVRLFTDGRGDLLTIGDEGQLHIKGPSAELTLWDRLFGTGTPSSPGPGNRFVWYNNGGQARLYTDGRGDLLAIGEKGQVHVKGPSAELTLWDRQFGTSPPSTASPGNRFVWYVDAGDARLYTDGRGDLLTIGSQGQLHVKGPAAELTFWDRQFGSSPPSPPGPGNRFVWYNSGGNARLFTDGEGDVVTVDAGGKITAKAIAVNNLAVAEYYRSPDQLVEGDVVVYDVDTDSVRLYGAAGTGSVFGSAPLPVWGVVVQSQGLLLNSGLQPGGSNIRVFAIAAAGKVRSRFQRTNLVTMIHKGAFVGPDALLPGGVLPLGGLSQASVPQIGRALADSSGTGAIGWVDIIFQITRTLSP